MNTRKTTAPAIDIGISGRGDRAKSRSAPFPLLAAAWQPFDMLGSYLRGPNLG
jgi:hypothetical protein